MSSSDAFGQSENTYPLDAESAAEMARLLDQDIVMTKAMRGLLWEQPQERRERLLDVLDIGCGPGGWVQAMARSYPDVQATGIDISRAMIAYAHAQAQVQGLYNAQFRVMNILEPLAFADASFDLVNARSIGSVVPPADWKRMLTEYQRVLRPGGIMRLTDAEWGFTNSAAHEELVGRGNAVWKKSGRSFSPTGRHLGIVPMLRYFMRDAGFEQLESTAYVLDYSAGTDAHEGIYQDFKQLFQIGKDYSIRMGVATPEEYDILVEQAQADMKARDFCGLMFILTVCGSKPAL